MTVFPALRASTLIVGIERHDSVAAMPTLKPCATIHGCHGLEAVALDAVRAPNGIANTTPANDDRKRKDHVAPFSILLPYGKLCMVSNTRAVATFKACLS